ncbi:MAG: beta-N-acetylhexosaminidase [Alphaproteobacteria bacterium]|nr:beta-N-acetylhexosaminidase [Alphaproteobacteria bacterium]
MTAPLASIFSLSGPELTKEQRAFFRDADPLGFILFARNCENPAQLHTLTSELKETLGRNCPILIDQEGGRVQRLKPPIWRKYDPARSFGERAENNMDEALQDLRFRTLRIAEELLECGITVNCDPVIDVLTSETHEVIGDRAYSDNPDIVSRLGISVCRQYLAAGVTPVIKHLPGHGRATLDSHKDLPRVNAPREDLRTRDFKAFRDVCASDIGGYIWSMAAHIVYEDIDPDRPSSISPTVISDIIRGEIGFDGLLLTDDLDMDALSAHGDVALRASASLQAGCDVALYCSGKLADMQKIAESVPNLSAKAQKRLQKAAEFRQMAA